MKENDPTAKVVLGGLTNSSWLALDELYERASRATSTSPRSTRTRQRPKGPVELVRRFRAVMRRNGDGRKPVWATELGLPASRGRSKSKSKLQTTDRGMAASSRAPTPRWPTRAASAPRVSIASTGTRGRPNTAATSSATPACSGTRARAGRTKRRAFGAYVRTARRLEGCVKTGAGRCR